MTKKHPMTGKRKYACEVCGHTEMLYPAAASPFRRSYGTQNVRLAKPCDECGSTLWTPFSTNAKATEKRAEQRKLDRNYIMAKKNVITPKTGHNCTRRVTKHQIETDKKPPK